MALVVFFLVFTGETIMAIMEMFETNQMFTITQIDWVNCPVDSHEGFGWSDSKAEVVPSNGNKENPTIYPITGYHPSYGINNLYSLVPDLIPEPGWKVVGKGPNTWVVVPPWYVFKQPASPPNRWPKALAALAVGALVLWGGIQLLPQAGVNQPQSTYQAK
jgi:hypothetical protein